MWLDALALAPPLPHTRILNQVWLDALGSGEHDADQPPPPPPPPPAAACDDDDDDDSGAVDFGAADWDQP